MKPILTLPIKPTPLVAMERPFFSGSVPLPPSVNASYKIVQFSNYHRRIGPTPELETFKLEASLWLKRHAEIDKEVLEAIQSTDEHTPLACEVRAYFVTEWKRDLDGILKASIDAAFDYLGLNDRLIVDLHARKLIDRANPRVELELRCIAR